MTSVSPAVIGEDRPRGAGTFHLRFLVGPNSTGGFWPSATPDPPGPRNCGHAGPSPAWPAVAKSPSATTAIIVLMSIPSVVGKSRRCQPTSNAPPTGDGLPRKQRPHRGSGGVKDVQPLRH